MVYSSSINVSLLEQIGSAQENLNETSVRRFDSFEAENRPASIVFRRVNYHVYDKKQHRFSTRFIGRGSSTKQILFNVNGHFAPGMNAILGPSGSGKSSLLDILADRNDKHGFSGEILVAGKVRSSIYKYQIGYVVQEDIINGSLTVRENLMFSANVRCRTKKTIDERKLLVDRIIDDLALQSCSDNLVGTHFIRGISGGEKRRVCIGMELVLRPKILFLDEPTSGLDSSTAEIVMKSLHYLSRQGCASQLRFRIKRIHLFFVKAQLYSRFINLGRPVYLGRSDELISYFSSYGFHCEEHNNPTDFVLDVLIECNQKGSTVLEEAFARQSVDVDRFPSEHEDIGQQSDEIVRPFIDELFYVSKRTLMNTIRDPTIAASQIIISILLAFLTGIVFHRLETTVEPGVRNRFGAIFFIIINQVYSTTTALESLIDQRSLFIHEHASGYYRILTYFLAKLTFDLLPMRLFPSLIYSSITYFLVGFQVNSVRFVTFATTIFLTTIFGSSICFLVSSTIPVFVVALIVIIFIFVVMMIFSGFLIDVKSIFTSLQWIRWFSAFRYSTNLLSINEFQGLVFCRSNETNHCFLTGEQVLTQQDIPHQTDWHFWSNYLALLLMILVSLLLSYIQLVRMKKTK